MDLLGNCLLHRESFLNEFFLPVSFRNSFKTTDLCACTSPVDKDRLAGVRVEVEVGGGAGDRAGEDPGKPQRLVTAQNEVIL